LGGEVGGYLGLMPMPNLRDASPAQRKRAAAAFLVAFCLAIIVFALVR
jgi:hypothetical protein